MEDDVTTIELQAVSGVALAAIGLWYDDYNGSGSPVTPNLVKVISFDAGVTKNDTTFKTSFPFVQAPWRGFNGAQYSGVLLRSQNIVPSLAFVADKMDNSVKLRWHINGSNNVGYEIESSTDGEGFTKIGNIGAASNANADYVFTDKKPDLSKSNYYRLKQLDRFGKGTYSDTRIVQFNGNSIISVVPNPASDFIKIYSKQSNVVVAVYDESGKRMATQSITNGVGQINIASFNKGSYTVVAESNGKRIETKKIVKQ